ncbi:MAG: MMPL family transporter [Methanocellales archaeon]|nr:MMPL family transporter [Methanocellales archaeon]MDD3291769.1 MMPL family transporter [Methanocellales archaeon]MDD5235119.1 MMPL family transporter [Methanocellales archaeon]MDD5485257.1 MMPL family transporter [Methanocellales archaeon]
MASIIEKYAEFVAHHPLLILAFVVLFTIFALSVPSAEQVGMAYEDMLPEGMEVIDTFNFISDQFVGSTDTCLVVLEVNPQYANSDEIRHVLDPRALDYADTLSKRAKLIEGVIDATSVADILKESNDGRIPKSLDESKSLSADNPLISQYISDDYAMSLVRIELQENVGEEEIVAELEDAIKAPKPQGLSVKLSGDPVMMVEMINLVAPTMAITSTYCFIGIILVLLIFCASIKYGLIPLVTIVFGIAWTVGILNIAGMGFGTATTGVLSMVMGLGIDFGIQVTVRFRRELEKMSAEKAIAKALGAVFIPMGTTVLAAAIGFRALLLGKLTMMGEMGTMMTIGVVACMLAAITAVPAFLVLGETDALSEVKERLQKGGKKK